MTHIYEKDTFISKDIAAKINKACSMSYPSDWFSEDETPYTVSVGFADGKIMDIRCCGSQNAPSWCEAILWAPNDEGLYETIHSNTVYDSILGKWELKDPDTENEYIVNVKIYEEEKKDMNTNSKRFNEMIFHSAKKNESAYVSIDTPNGQFRIYSEQEYGYGYHGAFITFIRDGQTVEQDLCMAEIDPDNPTQFSVKVWSEPRSEEYQKDIKFGQYIKPRCPYCGNDEVEEVDDFGNETKFFCESCENDFLMDDEGNYTTRNRVPLKPFEEKEKEQG